MNNVPANSALKAIIVLPCYNEESSLELTCISLGFGITSRSAPDNTLLIIVNNNSSDSTELIANNIKKNSWVNTVFIISEQEQGFVPARHAGNIMAAKIVKEKNWPMSEVLLIQADADTIYSEKYVEEMKLKSLSSGSNIILQSCVTFDSTFRKDQYSYLEFCKTIDNKFEKIISLLELDDNIVDDKATAYRLDDYFSWGGHHREHFQNGEEILAETSRLYMSAKTKGASRTFVETALVQHSARKVFKNPLLHLATGGFPRETSFMKKLHLSSNLTIPIDEISNTQNENVVMAMRSRELHIIGLFVLLTLHVNNTLKKQMPNAKGIPFRFLTYCPQRNIHELNNRPGLFLEDVFIALDNHGQDILEEVYRVCSISSPNNQPVKAPLSKYS